jgi:hypothetical protein
MQSHRIAILLIGFATISSVLFAFVPGLQPSDWHTQVTAIHGLHDIPLLGWLASDADAQTEPADGAER